MSGHSFGASIVLAGDKPTGLARKKLLALGKAAAPPHLIAADGGALYLLELGLKPNIIIGDNDSGEDGIFPDVEQKRFCKEKNFSDGAAAFTYATEETKGDIAVFAALGGRVDHLLVNLFLPATLPAHIERFHIFAADCILRYSQGEIEISGSEGDLLSIFPLTPQLRGITLTGLAYPLEDYDLQQGSSRCLSNIMTDERAIIKHKEGLALIVHFPQDYAKIE